MQAALAPGIKLLLSKTTSLQNAPTSTSSSRDRRYAFFIFFLTFFFYMTFILSRKPLSIVESALNETCSTDTDPKDQDKNKPNSQCDWGLFDDEEYQSIFDISDTCFMVSYTIGVLVSGYLGERLPVRYYLSFGMLMSGVFTSLFSLGFYWKISSLAFYASIQVLNGIMQSTGWPLVLASLVNWFGKSNRGFIMAAWNSNISLGNIFGSFLGKVFAFSWRIAFIIPGIIIAIVGIVCFFFLIEKPEHVHCSSPDHSGHKEGKEEEPLMQRSSPNEGEVTDVNPTNSQEVITNDPKAVNFNKALYIPGVVEFSLCMLFIQLASSLFIYYQVQHKSNVAQKEIDLTTLLSVGGIVGGILAGTVSDYTGKRATVCYIMLLVAAPLLFSSSYIEQQSAGAEIAISMLCGGFVQGPYSLISTAISADLGTHESIRGKSKASSTVAGIFAGAGSAGALLFRVVPASISSLNAVLYILISADIIACLCLSRLVFKEVCGWYKQRGRNIPARAAPLAQ